MPDSNQETPNDPITAHLVEALKAALKEDKTPSDPIVTRLIEALKVTLKTPPDPIDTQPRD